MRVFAVHMTLNIHKALQINLGEEIPDILSQTYLINLI